MSGKQRGSRMNTSQPDQKKNVLLIISDEWRPDQLGMDPALTPNYQALARDGVSFTNHYGQVMPCAPSRASILTGLYAMTHRVVTNGSPWHDITEISRNTCVLWAIRRSCLATLTPQPTRPAFRRWTRHFWTSKVYCPACPSVHLLARIRFRRVTICGGPICGVWDTNLTTQRMSCARTTRNQAAIAVLRGTRRSMPLNTATQPFLQISSFRGYLNRTKPGVQCSAT